MVAAALIGCSFVQLLRKAIENHSFSSYFLSNEVFSESGKEIKINFVLLE